MEVFHRACREWTPATWKFQAVVRAAHVFSHPRDIFQVLVTKGALETSAMLIVLMATCSQIRLEFTAAYTAVETTISILNLS